MLKFMCDHKGTLSLFTLFLLIPIMILSGVLMDFARVKAIEAHAASVTETYANSYLSVYDEMLNELYGLFAVSQADKDLFTELDKYMQASFNPSLKGDTTYDNTFMTELLLTDYPDALSLTGSALSDLNAAVGKPLVSDNNGSKNYDALQMQISEYVKFIGPTDVLTSSLKQLLDPQGGFSSGKSQNEVEQTNKNFQRIKKKNEIDNLISDLNNAIEVLYGAMHDYDKTIEKYYYSVNKKIPGVQGYAANEIYAHNRAKNTVITAFDELDALAGYILDDIQRFEDEANSSNDGQNDTNTDETTDNTDDTDDNDNTDSTETEENETAKYVLNDESQQWIRKIYHITNGKFLSDLEDIGDCSRSSCLASLGDNYDVSAEGHENHDFSAEVKNGNVIGYEQNIRNNIDKYYIQTEQSPDDINYSAADVREKRENLVLCAKNFQNNLEDIKERLNNLISEIEADINTAKDADEKENLQKFLEGIESDYDNIINSSDIAPEDSDKRKMWVVASFNYSDLADDFGGENGYAKVGEENIRSDLKSAFESGSYNSISKNEENIFPLYNSIDGYLKQLIAPQADIKSIAQDIRNWADGKRVDTSFIIFTDKDNVLSTDQYAVTLYTLSHYYTRFDDEHNKRQQGGITYRELYNTLKNWYSPTKEQEDKKNEIDNLTTDIWKAIDELKFNNIELRSGCKNKIMPYGNDGSDNTKKQDLRDILNDDESGLPSADTGTAFINKLMIILYDYGMFTCQTSDKTENKSDKGAAIVTKQPLSYQGIKLAMPSKDNGNKTEDDSSEIKYEDSETNFLLYGELEYIFNGDRDPQKNMNAVRNSLAIIRFVPNYISTYTITEINAIINQVQLALSWCPPVAIITAQLLRVAIAGLETWCDLDLLYAGNSVLLYKNDIGDISFIEKLKSTELGKKVYDQLNSYCDKKLDGKSGSGSVGNLKVNYCQYLVLLEAIFVKREDMVERTGDLIETNMNYIISGSSKNDDGKKTVNIDKFKLTKAYTSVKVSCKVKRNFVFIGGVFNARGAGYNDTADLADQMNAEDNNYEYTITREY